MSSLEQLEAYKFKQMFQLEEPKQAETIIQQPIVQPIIQQLQPVQVPTLNDSSINKLATAIANKLGKTRLAINFLELATTLATLKLLSPSNTIFAQNINAGATSTLTLNVQKKTVFLPIREQIVISTDHALTSTLSFDNVPIISDLDMVQARYANPLDFADILTIFPVLNNSTTVVKNTSGSPVYYSAWTTGGIISSDFWNRLIDKYFTVVSEEIDISVSPKYATQE